ncbi:uncharacterized protein LOC120686425 isoform X3 [Panicum virgatum]|uniref:uncharacterized protein LOC120686425 isoform X3 n=1 Tax=Panicum virgatum TaxID=38727 RepID=UPI0019D67171|nr:uncharacterized protein LOC120686425 isoform X3 [Panicum virgatum]
MMPGHLCEVVYTIGDELSFMSFMMELRRILANHPDHEDILDRHYDSNLSSTREHPLLPKQRAEQPARWLHIKLQVKEETSTTLLMRDDNLYICGFMNQQGVCYELLDDWDSEKLLPSEYNSKRLHWGVKYRTILDVADNEKAVKILGSIGQLDIRNFMVIAVSVLSHYPECWTDCGMNPRVALAGLILMVCECARMNAFYDSIADKWSESDKMDLRLDDVWKYVEMSYGLRKWKSRNYTEVPAPLRSLKAIYLVLNSRLPLGLGGEYGSNSRPRVELLTMRADLGVVGTKIIVYDGKRGQVIYTKREQGKQEMVDLVLTGPNIGISALGCFAIKVDIPGTATAGSSRGDAGGPIEWEWDCYDPAEVGDKPKTVTRTISSSGPGRNVEVTYAVMPDALEATVQVKLRLKDEHSHSVHGNIKARPRPHIADFKAWSVVLFRRTKGMGQRFSPTDSRFLQLARSVVGVPRGRELHIEVDLQIETSNIQGCKPLKVHFYFEAGQNHWRSLVNGDEIEVNVTWYPADPDRQAQTHQIMPQRRPDVSYIIGDEGGFSRFIEGLRNTVADHPSRREDVLDNLDPSKRDHPVMISEERLRWLEIKLQVQGEETSTTLAVQADSLEVIGFMNQKGNWYELYRRRLPGNYKSQLLDWGTSLRESSNYTEILGAENKEEVVEILKSARLGKTFAADAVRVLSHYTAVADGDNPSSGGARIELQEGISSSSSSSCLPFPRSFFSNLQRRLRRGSMEFPVTRGARASPDPPLYPLRLALVGLSVMVCQSARMNRLHDAIAGGWETGARFTTQLLDYIENWEEISRALLVWKDHSYEAWIKDERLERIGIKSPEEALDVVHLVCRVPIRGKELERSVYTYDSSCAEFQSGGKN